MLISEDLLRRLDVPGPRYTSYPTADRFDESFGPQQYRQALAARSDGPGAVAAGALSLYVHIPFCRQLCYYCACNKVITKHPERAQEYLEALGREIDLHVQVLGRGQPVSQLHLGGGTPTFLTDAELGGLMQAIRSVWTVRDGAEVSIEVDPRTATPQRLRTLADMGFTRLSFGVQDFDEAVQQAVHRIQPHSQVVELVHAAREIGFSSINADLIYGLPRQTPESFGPTLSKICALRPDRIALYAYAHLPSRFKSQRRIHAEDLPTAAQRLGMLGSAIDTFLTQGYTYIGMDHFALPTDELARARRQGRLHRNFQGYTTQPDGDLIGLGVSAIGQVGATYSQNAKDLPGYYEAIGRGEFAVVRGMQVPREDLVRRAAIMAIMCQGRLDLDALDEAHLVDSATLFADELQRLQPFVDEGLLEREDRAWHVTSLGWYFVRAIAMVFDRHVSRAPEQRVRFSRVI